MCSIISYVILLQVLLRIVARPALSSLPVRTPFRCYSPQDRSISDSTKAFLNLTSAPTSTHHRHTQHCSPSWRYSRLNVSRTKCPCMTPLMTVPKSECATNGTKLLGESRKLKCEYNAANPGIYPGLSYYRISYSQLADRLPTGIFRSIAWQSLEPHPPLNLARFMIHELSGGEVVPAQKNQEKVWRLEKLCRHRKSRTSNSYVPPLTMLMSCVQNKVSGELFAYM